MIMNNINDVSTLNEIRFKNYDFLNNITISEILEKLPKENSCQLRISLTQICNEKCFFCHNEWNLKEKSTFDEIIFKKIIDTMSKYWVKQRIRFTWWEPLLYKWLPNLIKYSKNALPTSDVWLTTNALLLENRAQEIVDAWLDKITVSLHSLNAKNYKEITKVDWLNKVLNWLEKLRKVWFEWQISINSVIWSNNIDEVFSLDSFCILNNYKLKLLDILPFTKELEKYTLSQEQIVKLSNINKIKWTRTQSKCVTCEKNNICWWEAEYLRLSPSWIMNPCLSLKEKDIDLNSLKDNISIEKWILLWFRRVIDLSI